MAEEAKKTYKVKPGMVWGTNPQLGEGETVELTEAEAAGFLDLLEPADAPKEGEEKPGASGGVVPRKPS